MNILNSWQRSLRYIDAAKGYLETPEEYVRFFDVRINGKLRHLVTYQFNEKGRSLRFLHTDFAQFLSTKYRRARSSYAYAKRKNILNCVNRHLKGEVFLKSDIKSYFDSITYENMMKRIEKLKINENDIDTVALMTKACFYQGRLPLGFCSSPVLSDLYLASFDYKYQKNKMVTYTRYADDFILSASGQDARENLIACRIQMEKDLDLLDLQLNRKKTYIRNLKYPGDAIHVLGLNIVRTESETNRVTISNQYIRKTCKDLCEWINRSEFENDDECFAKLYGKISFIKQCSDSSYKKLQKMIRIKSGYEGSLTAKELKRKSD